MAESPGAGMKRVRLDFETDLPGDLLHALLEQFAEDAMGEDRPHEMDVTITPAETANRENPA